MSANLKEFVHHCFPNLTQDDLNALFKKLDEMGVSSVNELQYLEKSDLVPPLKPVQERKLIDLSKQDSNFKQSSNTSAGAEKRSFSDESFEETTRNNYGSQSAISINFNSATIKAKNAKVGKGNAYMGTAKDIKEIAGKLPAIIQQPSNTKIDIDFGSAKLDAEQFNAGEGDAVYLIQDKGHSDFSFANESDDCNIVELFKNAAKVSKDVVKSHLFDDNVYDVMPWGRSQALICNYLFKDKPGHSRNGATKDTEYLESLLEYLGFKISYMKQDETEADLKKRIKEFVNSREVAEAPIVLLFIGSHGQQINNVDYFWDSQKETIQVSSIIDLFAVPALKDKPKLFWFQFCRVNKKDAVQADSIEVESFEDWYLRQNPSSDDVEQLPDSMSHMFLAYATQPEQKAYRTASGSWFISAIGVVFSKHAHEHDFKVMIENVNTAVVQKNQKNYVQMCDLKSGLKKKLFFDPQ